MAFADNCSKTPVTHEFHGLSVHSAEWFGDMRDHWWNEDFLRFLAKMWNVETMRSVLDVGCGVGHWGRLLLQVLPPDCSVTGVDREALWVEKATERAGAVGSSKRLRFRVAEVEQLPFDDNTFDLATCQTVLMHLRDAERGLAEMVRVTRPGGLVVAVEPTNILGPALLDSIVLRDPPEVVAALLEFQLRCQQGKARLGEGNDLIGASLPAMFASAGLQGVQLRLNDRVAPMLAPYASNAARAVVEQVRDTATRGIWMWNRKTTQRYFMAGGGLEAEFDAEWSAAVASLRRIADALSAGKYAGVDHGLCYIIWGRKPVPGQR